MGMVFEESVELGGRNPAYSVGQHRGNHLCLFYPRSQFLQDNSRPHTVCILMGYLKVHVAVLLLSSRSTHLFPTVHVWVEKRRRLTNLHGQLNTLE